MIANKTQGKLTRGRSYPAAVVCGGSTPFVKIEDPAVIGLWNALSRPGSGSKVSPRFKPIASSVRSPAAAVIAGDPASSKWAPSASVRRGLHGRRARWSRACVCCAAITGSGWTTPDFTDT